MLRGLLMVSVTDTNIHKNSEFQTSTPLTFFSKAAVIQLGAALP